MTPASPRDTSESNIQFKLNTTDCTDLRRKNVQISQSFAQVSTKEHTGANSWIKSAPEAKKLRKKSENRAKGNQVPVKNTLEWDKLKQILLFPGNL